METDWKGPRPFEPHLGQVCVERLFWKMVVCGAVLLFLASGCSKSEVSAEAGLENEVVKLQQEVAQLKGEVSRQRNELHEMRRRVELAGRMPRRDKDMQFGPNGTNSLARTMGRKGLPSREELEARRKMMQDPEMRKKFEAEHKARMEERRRQHEERRREMEERRRARPAPTADAPTAAPAVAPAK